MKFTELNILKLDEAMIEYGFEPIRHFEYEDSVGCTIRLIPNYPLPGTGGVWCLGIEVTSTVNAFAFIGAASQQLTPEDAVDLTSCAIQQQIARRGTDETAIFYFRHFVLEEI